MFSSKGNTKFSFMLDLGFKVKLRVTTVMSVMSLYILKHEHGLLLGDIHVLFGHYQNLMHHNFGTK